jgi:hypothetical protein
VKEKPKGPISKEWERWKRKRTTAGLPRLSNNHYLHFGTSSCKFLYTDNNNKKSMIYYYYYYCYYYSYLSTLTKKTHQSSPKREPTGTDVKEKGVIPEELKILIVTNIIL